MNFSVKGFSAVDLREEEPIIKKDLIHIIWVFIIGEIGPLL
jgi:hypothetical protein